MNDLRSRNRTLAPVSEIGLSTGEVVSNPGAKRSKSRGNPLFESSRSALPADPVSPDDAMRPAVQRPSTPEPSSGGAVTNVEPAASTDDEAEKKAGDKSLSFPVSRELRSMPISANNVDDVEETVALDAVAPPGARTKGKANSGGRDGNEGPASRPTIRREFAEEGEPEDDKFPWHYQFDDDEPQELQAKSPLLSRAFRSSVG